MPQRFLSSKGGLGIINNPDLYEISRGLIAVSSLSHPSLLYPPSFTPGIQVHPQCDCSHSARTDTTGGVHNNHCYVRNIHRSNTLCTAGGGGCKRIETLMHLFMEDPESHGARCGNTAKSCQFTTTTCMGRERERERAGFTFTTFAV